MAGQKRHYRKRRRTRQHDGARTKDVPEGDEPIEDEEGGIQVDGTVVVQRRGAVFVVELDNGHEVLAHTAGKMRRFRIRIMPGDRVSVTLSPYDLTKGRITYRYRSPN